MQLLLVLLWNVNFDYIFSPKVAKFTSIATTCCGGANTGSIAHCVAHEKVSTIKAPDPVLVYDFYLLGSTKWLEESERNAAARMAPVAL